MRIFKKILISFFIILITIMSFATGASYAAEPTDAQRQAIVKVVVKTIKEGNQNGILRYSWDHRNVGYSGSRVRNHNKQSTESTWYLRGEDISRVMNALKEDITKRYKNNEAMLKRAAAITKISTGYKCRTLGADIYGTVAFDCSSLASAAYSMAYGTTFLWNSKGFLQNSSSLFNEIPVSQAKPGDVLWKSGHVAIYLGDYEGDGKTYIGEAGGLSSVNTNEKKAKVSALLADFLVEHPTYIKEHPNYNPKAGLPVIELPEDCIRSSNKQVVIRSINLNNCEFTKAYSYKGEIKPGREIDVSGTAGGGLTVEEVNKTEITLGTGTATIGYWPDNYKIEDQALINSDGYFHKGTPSYGGYTSVVSPLTWLLEQASDVLDWLAGFITMVLKMQVIGWTAIAENLISNGLVWGAQDISKQDTTSTGSVINDTTGLPIVTTNKVTVEDIIFNNVPLLDINFFDFEKAGGQTLEANSPIYKIRQLIAQWYYTFRIIAIIFMLVILIYNIVKLVASTAVSEKTNAKSSLKDWLIAFIIVFTIHYFMIAVITINNQVIQILEPIATTSVKADEASNNGSELWATDIDNNSITQNNEESLYEQIRIQAYDISAISGWTGTIMYIIMVIYLFMFVFLYIKRLFIIAMLTIISPIVAALYALNKKTYKINTWVKEYTYNVLIQLIHALVYTVLVAVALNLAKTSTIVGGLFALAMLGFIFTAEKIVKKILGYESKTLGGLTDSLGAQFALFFASKKATSYLGRGAIYTAGAAKELGRKIKNRKIAEVRDEEQRQDNILDTGYARNVAGIRALLSVSGQTLKDAYSKAKTDDSQSGSTAKGFFELGSNVKEEFKNKYQQYFQEELRNKYRGTREWQDTANKMHKESNKAKKAFLQNRALGLTNAVIATAGITLGIPLLFIDMNKGIAVSAAGVNAFSNAFTRKRISGRKSYQHDLKGKKMLFFFASPMLAPGYANAISNTIEEREVYKTRFGEVLETLENAKQKELDVLEKMKEMYPQAEETKDENPVIQQRLNELKENVQKAEHREFKKSLDKTLTKLTEDDIKKHVEEYIKQHNVSKLSAKDYYNIRDVINRELRKNGHDAQISDSFNNNIRDEVRRQVGMPQQVLTEVKRPNGEKRAEYRSKVEVKDITKICKEIAKEHKKDIDDSVIKDMVHELKKDKEFRNVMNTQNTEKIIEKVKDKLDEKLKDYELSKKLSHELEEKMEKHMKEKTRKEEKTVDEIISSLKKEELVPILTKAINKEGGMYVRHENKKYSELMKDVKKLDELNETYYNLTGERIYKDVRKLVEGFRKDLLSK